MRTEFRSAPFAFSDGLAEWLRGVDSYAAEAAGANLAETLILLDRWLKTKFEKR